MSKFKKKMANKAIDSGEAIFRLVDAVPNHTSKSQR